MEKVRLGDVCEIYTGTGFPVKYQGKENGDYPFFKVGDIAQNVIKGYRTLKECNNYVDIFDVKEIKGTIIPKGTIVFAKIGEAVKLNRRAITACDCLIDNNAIGIKPNINFLDIKYFFHYMCKVKLEEFAEKTTVPSVKKSTIEKMDMLVPTIEEQRHIATILDKVTDLIDKRKQQLKKLDEIVKARFVEMFGDVIHNDKKWNVSLFSKITSSRLGKMLDSKKQTGESSYPYLANFNVQWFKFDLENLNEMDFDEKDRKEFELLDGDLLVCEGGEIGRCAVWHNELQLCYFQKALHRVRCDKKIILPDYLAWWFKYNCEHNGFAAIEGAKATIAHLPGAKLKLLKVAVPPIELQNQFADFVEQTDKSKSEIQKGLDKLELLKSALMQKYFG